MDKVRFGRAIGRGAREAARSLMDAADAASSPDPRSAAPHVQRAVQHAAETRQTLHEGKAHVRRAAVAGGKGAAKGIFAPLRRASGVLWLEITGTFFAFVALFILQGAWRLRTAWHTGTGLAGDRGRLVMHAGLFVLFAYFAISSFIRARRRERRA